MLVEGTELAVSARGAFVVGSTTELFVIARGVFTTGVFRTVFMVGTTTVLEGTTVFSFVSVHDFIA